MTAIPSDAIAKFNQGVAQPGRVPHLYIGSSKHLSVLAKARRKAASLKSECKFCVKVFSKAGIKQHETACFFNPANIRNCLVCGNIIKRKNKPGDGGTCSYSCSNTLFHTGPNHGNWKNRARPTCFHFHEKKCVVCGEKNIVEVHHYDGDKLNNSPENLVPMCPTHHQYWHSRYKHLIEKRVTKYVTKFKRSSKP